MVKWLPGSSTTWYSTNDNLAGTAVLGTVGDKSKEWSTTFDLKYFTYFMFTYEGSADYYQIMNKAFLNLDASGRLPRVIGGVTSPAVSREVLKSTNQPDAY